ncbi:hypothetical protein [Brevibacterium sp. JSBI002]|uniref:hypothetical protein n=1 Tax=Brevibacterium sp. JSBI002 TaxID=2886045 RepID=UPI00222E6DC4|nr:hypothetical protein [Brevibacterium sp. JSBI002]UZD62292.1 hypothetical protein LJ362_16815 [Brevibacterium sp. JSBI002]
MKSELTSTDSLPVSWAELDSADELAAGVSTSPEPVAGVSTSPEPVAGVSTSPEPVAGPETESDDDVFRVELFGAADAFSVLSTGEAEDGRERGGAEDPAFVLVDVDLAPAEVLEEPLPVGFCAVAFDAFDFAVDAFVPVVLEVAVFVPIDLEAVDLEAVDSEAVDFDPAGLDAEVLADVDDAPLVVPDFVAPDFEDAVFEAAASVSVSAPEVVEVERVDPDAFGLRRREDCIDAAGSVRAVRDVFVSPSCLPSSEFPPEKNTSTGRSLEFASGINAPSPRPRPLFLRSTTTYSSIRNFFGGFPIGQGTAGMWVI